MSINALPLDQQQRLEYFLDETSRSYADYNLNGKTFESARKLFVVNAMFFSFILQLSVDYKLSSHSVEIDLLKKHLSSWIEQFLIHERSRAFTASDEFIFISKVKFPSQAILRYSSKQSHEQY